MKSIPKYFPSWIATAKVPKRGGSLTQVLAQDTTTLGYLAGQNAKARALDGRQRRRLAGEGDAWTGINRRARKLPS
jgi:hypothetical protein